MPFAAARPQMVVGACCGARPSAPRQAPGVAARRPRAASRGVAAAASSMQPGADPAPAWPPFDYESAGVILDSEKTSFPSLPEIAPRGGGGGEARAETDDEEDTEVDDVLQSYGTTFFRGVDERLQSFSSARKLIRAIDQGIARAEATAGVASSDASRQATTSAVSSVLTAWVEDGGTLPEEFTLPSGGPGYGRRALHVDKLGRYGIIVMTWAPGQSTAIHDHDDMWCVECVYAGRIKVSAFDVRPSQAGLFHLTPEVASFGNVGSAGQLIPPKDVHMISNASDDVACTIHVYGGYMEKCQVFSPVAQGTNDGDGSEGGLYRRESKSLFFTPKPWSNMCG